MPSPLTSSFASAAAGNAQDGGGNRREGSTGGEWSRSRTNGATQTFRRPSLATNMSHSRDTSQPSSAVPSSTSGAYIPPHMNSNYQGPYRNGTSNDLRYSKEQLISIYKNQRDTGSLSNNLPSLFSGPWSPTEPKNGVAASWGKREDGKEQITGPDVCWDHDGKVQPLGLSDITDEEKEFFSTSVNSPLKALTGGKDGTPGTGNRKTSISQSGPYNNSPHSGRPGPRRRETGDSVSGANPLSPTGNTRFFRDEVNTSTPPAALLRRKTDVKDPTSDSKSTSKAKDETIREETSSPFDSLKRRATGGPLSAGPNAPESPWPTAPHSATFGGMGAFGNFSLGSGAANPELNEKDKRPGFGSLRGESRFKGLLSKASSEDITSGASEKPGNNLAKLTEDETGEADQGWPGARQPRQNRSDTNPYADDIPHSGAPGFDTDPRSQVGGDIGFSAFSDSIRNLVATHPHQQTPSRNPNQDPTSPTVTNPYQSPEGDHRNVGDDSQDMSDVRRLDFSTLGSLREDSSVDAFGSLRGKNAFDDRSQTSSAGPSRGFSAFGGLPNIGGPSWSGDPIGSTGTPTKDRSGFPSAFGNSMFGELQSPSLGGNGLFGSNTGTFGRSSSKMGSLFPQAMQDQMREGHRMDASGDGPLGMKKDADQHDTGTGAFFGDAGAAPQGSESESAAEPGYQYAQSSAYGQLPSAPGSGAMSKVGPADIQLNTDLNAGPFNEIPGSSQLPASQQRQMVMPDRMRWIYRDPQGNVQGPWTGLEMHDWFKAGFFTAELQVKKVEELDYEPLAQLVRRIGNSREPFLVPQIGVPHGPAPPSGHPWAGGTSVSGGVPQGSGTQPPFATSFPSFGTTLTADQQNALERRKQEEQYLMARQKEHLAQQQVLMKQMALQGGPHSLQHGLQHHSSAHSLHSQPSFGSMTSPSAFQPSPIQAPIQPPLMPGFPEPVRHPQQAPFGGQSGRTDVDELPPFFERMTLSRGQHPFGGGPFSSRAPEGPLQQPIGNMLQDRARLQAEQDQFMKLGGDPLSGFQNDDRLNEFHDLRSQFDDDSGAPVGQDPSTVPIGGARTRPDGGSKRALAQKSSSSFEGKEPQESPEPEMLSLSKQAQDVQQQQQQQQAPSAWAIKSDAIQSIVPPPQSASPLPAPAAKRHHNVADTLVAESRSQTQTPSETPTTTLAPWADKTAEAAKGPSLKEIQEAEARKAAKAEELAAAARRVQADFEARQAASVQQPAPGLPSTSTWANANGPTTPVTPSSVWAKAGPNKAVTPVANAKKTLAQIQKEEESRKHKAASAAAAAQQAAIGGNTNAIGGKRYAELAGKVVPITTSPAATATSGAWTTVGQGGRVKAPATVVATPGPTPRTASGTVPVQTKPRPAAPRAPSIVSSQSGSQSKATEELMKWAKVQLGKGLASGINVDEFVQSLLILPNETEIISDSVYANSQTLDGRRFAEEFVRKRKLADKGVVEGTPIPNGAHSAAGMGNGGWSEVAKKGPEKKDDSASNAAFKVVASKKKGRR